MHLGEGAPGTLREIGLFGGLSDETLRFFGETLNVLSVGEGETLYREGESGRILYVILEGRIHLGRAAKDGTEHVVTTLAAGEWFGEQSILDVQPRPTSARAAMSTVLLAISAHDLDVLYRRELKAYTLLVLNLAREMSRHLRVCETRLFTYAHS